MLDYFMHPTAQSGGTESFSFGQKLKGTLTNYGFYLAISLMLFMALNFIDIVISKYFHYSFVEQIKLSSLKVKEKFGTYSVLMILLVGPFFEEVLFRLPLTFTKLGIGIAFSLVIYRLLADDFFIFFYNEPMQYLKVLAPLLSFFSIAYFLPAGILEIIKRKYFPFLFYFSAVCFALVHITNFAPYNTEIPFFYPIFVLPQFLMGIFIGYTRIRYGFLYGLILHSLINLPSVILNF